MSNKYNDQSIKTLNARDHVRLRVGNYTGGTLNPTHLIKEIYYNAQDEHEIGHGNKIIVSYNTQTNIISVQDFAQGFPVGIIRPEDGKTVLQAAADTLNTSGKFDGEVYNNNVTGLNGQGLKITNFLSEFLEITTANSTGKSEYIKFKDGEFIERKYKNINADVHGTIITWKPDSSFFQNALCDINELKQLFTECAALHPKLTIEFNCNGEQFIYHSENGLIDLLNKNISKKEILSNRFIISKLADNTPGSDRLDIALTYTSDYSEKIVPYVNAALTESGVHIAAIKAGLTRQINRYAYDNNLLKKNDDQLTQSELAEGLVLIFNIKAGGVAYTGQAKEKVSDLDKTLINQVINNEFVDWLNNNPKDAKTIINKALTARKAREAAQKAKDGIRNAGTKNKKFISLPTKLTDCYNKKRDECEIYITEGDSAASGMIAKRDGKNQAIFPIRGKILSCRKAATEKIYANQEISNIVKALGLDINKDTGKLIYDDKKLRYNKIILASDADSDGYQIRLLLINMFWWLCPDLVTRGHLYAAIPPLYRITTNKNEYVYLKDDKELAEYKKKHKNESYILGKNKGLGEQSPDELAYCLLKETTRNIQQINVDNMKAADDMLEMFMGSDVEPRRKYLLEHSNEVTIDIE